MTKRQLKDIYQNPTYKELKVIRLLVDKLLYMFNKNYKPEFKRVLITRQQINQLNDGEYTIYHKQTGKEYILATVSRKIRKINEIEETSEFVFTHPEIFPMSTVYIDLPVDFELED